MSSFENPYKQKPKEGPFSYEPIKMDWKGLDKEIESLGKDIDKFQSALDDAPENADESFGDKVLGSAGDIAKFGMNQYANFKNTSSSTQESDMQTIQSGVQGAALGMQLGGPWGALAGGVVGTGLGFIDKAHDTKKRIEKEDQERIEFLEKRKKDRAEAYAASKGKAKLETEMETRENQFRFNMPRYRNS